jgi:hypothetical protein
MKSNQRRKSQKDNYVYINSWMHPPMFAPLHLQLHAIIPMKIKREKYALENPSKRLLYKEGKGTSAQSLAHYCEP